ncbi:MAG: PHP domain-containing protein, partial [Niameybacter sp.]
MNNYTITHCHTQLSSGTTNIDSITTYEDYILRAKSLGMKAIAFTEHGNIFSWVKKKLTCEEHGIKYIHAMEAYITKSLDSKVRDNYHCCLYALNHDGVKELNKLSSISFNKEHKYYAPRITFSELLNTS